MWQRRYRKRQLRELKNAMHSDSQRNTGPVQRLAFGCLGPVVGNDEASMQLAMVRINSDDLNGMETTDA
jgi:hypothetical protein